jgi:hypothetical protein
MAWRQSATNINSARGPMAADVDIAISSVA